MFWNGFPVDKLGDEKLKINEDIYDESENLQNVLTNTSIIPLKKLNDMVKKIDNILESLDFQNYKPIRDETKSGRYKCS